jgi:hypothetical protein
LRDLGKDAFTGGHWTHDIQSGTRGYLTDFEFVQNMILKTAQKSFKQE